MESFPITMIYIGTILWKNRHRMMDINPELITANWDTLANNFCDRRLRIGTWRVMDLRWHWILFAAKKCSMKNILILNRKLHDDIFVDIRILEEWLNFIKMNCTTLLWQSASKSSIWRFVITEKAPTRAISWLTSLKSLRLRKLLD